MYSPPTASPCMRRNTRSSTGAAMPMVSLLGRTDGERRDGHREDRPYQRLLAAEPVADPAEQRSADRTHEEPRGEGAVGGEQRGRRVTAGKKCAPICLAKNPNSAKSYHSSTLPTTPAITPRRTALGVRNSCVTTPGGDLGRTKGHGVSCWGKPGSGYGGGADGTPEER